MIRKNPKKNAWKRLQRGNKKRVLKVQESFQCSSKFSLAYHFIHFVPLLYCITSHRALVGSKNISPELLAPVLEKLRDHLISKNVAADIAQKLCNSVSEKLEGKVRYFCLIFLRFFEFLRYVKND